MTVATLERPSGVRASAPPKESSERPRYQVSINPLTELGELYRRWSDGIDEFRAEIDAVKDSKILDVVHTPGSSRVLLAPLAQPSREARVTPEQYMGAGDMVEPPWQVRLNKRVRSWVRGFRQVGSPRTPVAS